MLFSPVETARLGAELQATVAPSESQGTPMDADTIDNIINSADDIALSWYSILSGKPLPTAPVPVQTYIPQGAVTQAAYDNPTAALVLSQVTQPWVIVGIAIAVVGLVYLSQR